MEKKCFLGECEDEEAKNDCNPLDQVEQGVLDRAEHGEDDRHADHVNCRWRGTHRRKSSEHGVGRRVRGERPIFEEKNISADERQLGV